MCNVTKIRKRFHFLLTGGEIRDIIWSRTISRYIIRYRKENRNGKESGQGERKVEGASRGG